MNWIMFSAINHAEQRYTEVGNPEFSLGPPIEGTPFVIRSLLPDGSLADLYADSTEAGIAPQSMLLDFDFFALGTKKLGKLLCRRRDGRGQLNDWWQWKLGHYTFTAIFRADPIANEQFLRRAA